jgi:glycosyltransferase involved in cell wall biosynthesis
VGIDVESYNQQGAVKESLNIPADRVVVTCVGEINANKNHVFLLRGWKKVQDKVGNAHLWIVGIGPLAEKVKEFARELHLSNVHFLGYRTDIPAILGDSDIVTLVSKREGLPRCIMEGMATAKPIVATQIRGNVDLVHENETGFLVPLEDEDELARVLLLLIQDKSLRQQMGAAGKQRIQPYSVEEVGRQLTAIYDRFLAEE